MKKHIVLIDWENVQPGIEKLFALDNLMLYLFVGSTQNKLPFSLVTEVQKLGARAEYVKVGKQGKNASDMHLAFQVGRLSVQEPNADFHIISKDTDFDLLIQHLKERKINASKWIDLGSIPALNILNKTPKTNLDVVRLWLGRPVRVRPKTILKLTNTLKVVVFLNKLADSAISALIDEMQEKKLILVQDETVVYLGPSTA